MTKEERIREFNRKWEFEGFEIASWYEGHQLAIPLNVDEEILVLSGISNYIAILTEAKQIMEAE